MRANAGLERADFLLAGGGLSSATAAETLRTAGAEGSVVMLSAGQLPPYHHPPFSKRYFSETRTRRSFSSIQKASTAIMRSTSG